MSGASKLHLLNCFTRLCLTESNLAVQASTYYDKANLESFYFLFAVVCMNKSTAVCFNINVLIETKPKRYFCENQRILFATNFIFRSFLFGQRKRNQISALNHSWDFCMSIYFRCLNVFSNTLINTI